jgi:hypothetical protein
MWQLTVLPASSKKLETTQLMFLPGGIFEDLANHPDGRYHEYYPYQPDEALEELR